MLLGMVPVTLVAALATSQNEVFTVIVKDEHTEAAIADATVVVKSSNPGMEELTSNTNANGESVFEEITDYFNDGGTELAITYIVTAENYSKVEITETITLTADTKSIEVKLADTVPPIIIDIDGNPQTWVKEAITLSVVCQDADVSEYKLNNGSWQASNNFSIVENGTYNFYAKDMAGNESIAKQITVSFVDQYAPQISGVVINPDSWTNQEVELEVVATDDGCGVSEYKMDDGAWQASNLFKVANDTEHRFYVKDAIGNESTEAFVITVDKFDNVCPEISAVTPQEGWSNTSITFTVAATDNKSGVAWYSVDDNSENAAWQKSNEFIISDTQEHTFYVKDNAGNISAGFVAAKAKIETVKPIIEGVELSITELTAETIVFTVNASDQGGSGIAQYRMDNGEWQAGNAFEVNDDATHDFYVKDAAGNVSVKYSKCAENYIMNAPGITKITQDPDKGWTNEAVTLTIAASASKSDKGNKIVKYKMDNGEWQDSNEFSIEDNNEHTFYVQDNVGKQSEGTKYQVTNFDNVAPTLIKLPDSEHIVYFKLKNDNIVAQAINFLSFGCFFNKEWQIETNAIDEGVGTIVSGINNVKVEFTPSDKSKEAFWKETTPSGDSRIVFSLAEEEIKEFQGSVRLILTDNAGNEEIFDVNTNNSNLRTTTFMVENTAPTIRNVETKAVNSSTMDDSNNVSGNFQYSFSTNDNESGIYKVSLTINNAEKILYQFTEEGSQLKGGDYSYTVETDDTSKTNYIAPNTNGKYDAVITVVDHAGNVATTAIDSIGIDETSPVITGFEFMVDNKAADKTDVVATDYGYYFNEEVKVYITAEDYSSANETNSGVKEIHYVAKDIDNPTTEGTIQPDQDEKYWFTINKDFKGQIYAYAVDNVGNSIKTGVKLGTCQDNKTVVLEEDGTYKNYARPSGSILESPDLHKTTSDIKIEAPQTEVTQNDAYNFLNDENREVTGYFESDDKKAYDDTQLVPLYAENPTIKVTVEDTYSGIKNVKMTVYEGSTSTEIRNIEIPNAISDDDLNDLLGINGSFKREQGSNLIQEVSIELEVIGNSNNMVLLVELTDRAGNISYDYYTFGIDKTAPEIAVAYDNNTALNEKYFAAARTATITVKERNFDAKDFSFAFMQDGEVYVVNDLDWSEPTGTGDDTTHTATYDFDKNADYLLGSTDNKEQNKPYFRYSDLAGNPSEPVNFDGNVAPTDFTIDTISPVVTVSYDNNTALNEKYFAAARTATVVINEHNFDTLNSAEFALSAKINGTDIEKQPEVEWKHDGDVHTATIAFAADADYTFDVEVTDMAGNVNDKVNYGDSVAYNEFVVDQTIVKPTIGGIANGGAYKGNVVPTISFEDVNYDSYEIKLVRTRKGEKNVNVTAEFIKGVDEQAQKITGSFDTFSKVVENDGIYTLTLKVKDKAGNEESEEYRFTVNRFGSVYEYSDELAALIKDGGQYVTGIKNDLVITEYNADRLIAGSLQILITRDGEAVDVDFTSTPEVNKAAGIGASGWYQYAYTLKASNFEKDGVYKISLTSK